jgi:hypothetical protein
MIFLIFQISTTPMSYLKFVSHIEIEIQNPDYDLIRISVIDLCFDPNLIFIYEYKKSNIISGIDNLIINRPQFKEFK